MRKYKQLHAHIKTITITHINTVFMGKLKAENPQLSVYYNDRDHVTIIVQTPHKLSSLSPIVTHYTSSDLTSHMFKSPPPVSLPLLRNPRWNCTSWVQIPLVCTTQSSLASPSMCVQISFTSIVTTDSKLALSPTSSTSLHWTVHALQLTDVFFSWFMS